LVRAADVKVMIAVAIGVPRDRPSPKPDAQIDFEPGMVVRESDQVIALRG
jgi:hypothetical protein